MPWVILLSRVLMAAIFIHSGYGKAMHPSATTAMLAHYNLPLPGLGYAVSLLVEIGAGIAFLLGWKGQAAALVLAVWCVATAFVAHYHPGDNGQMMLRRLDERQAEAFALARGDQARAGRIDLLEIFVADVFQPEKPGTEFGVMSDAFHEVFDLRTLLADDSEVCVNVFLPKDFESAQRLSVSFPRLDGSHHDEGWSLTQGGKRSV